jgi:spore maturation protein CgeB
MRIVILGLSITSSWGNGHATTWRALVKGLAERGHDVLFLERDVPWYAANRDIEGFPWCRIDLYPGLQALSARNEIADADLVLVGSFVPDGIEVARLVQATARGVAAFYDIDTPVTLAALADGSCSYLSPGTVRGFDLYLSFTGGPTLDRIERELGAPMARALYCSVDTAHYRPRHEGLRWDLSYLGTYASDRQPVLERLLIEPARRAPDRRFVVAGAQYPDGIVWPPNVERIEHVAPADHPAFYGHSRFTLNATRADMVRAGWSPSVRLFEAASCGTAILSDSWPGLETIFEPGRDILVAERPEDVMEAIGRWPEDRVRELASRARDRVLAAHTAEHRAAALEQHAQEALPHVARRADRLRGMTARGRRGRKSATNSGWLR